MKEIEPETSHIATKNAFEKDDEVTCCLWLLSLELSILSRIEYQMLIIDARGSIKGCVVNSR